MSEDSKNMDYYAALASEAPAPQELRRYAGRGFWTAILSLFAITVLMLGAAIHYAGVEDEERAGAPPPQELDLGLPAIEELIAAAEAAAVEKTLPKVDEALGPVFAPVHAAVPSYADFHYSVFGEYTELTQAALGNVSTEMEKQLFEKFNARLHDALRQIETELISNMKGEVSAALEERRVAEGEGTVISEATMVGVRDTLGRFRVSAPVEAIAVIGAAKIGARAVSTALSKSLLKLIGKLGVKTAGKTMGVGGGAAAGAAFGSFGGPVGAFVGGLGGGAIAWFAIDYAVLKIDEFFNREDFEKELHTMITAERDKLRIALSDYLQGRDSFEGGKTINEIRETR